MLANIPLHEHQQSELAMDDQLNRQQCFVEQFERHHSRLFGFIYSMLRDREATQEVLQETCVTLWEKFDDYDPATPFTRWAFTVARYKVLSHIQASSRQERPFDADVVERLASVQESLPESASSAREQALKHCVEHLSAAQQQLLWKCYDGQSTVRQVAEEIGRSPQSVHNSLKSIRNKLLACVKRTLSREGS